MSHAVPLTGSQINWNQVFYFSEVASCGSLKEAAAKLGLSSSTLSEHISLLEKDLHVQLFHRHHRKLELTSEGSKLFQYAKQMFETGMRLIDVVSPLPLGYYPVSIGLVACFSLPVAYRLIGDFLREKKQSHTKLLHASHEQLERGLAESEFDFGFSDRPPERKDLVGQLVSSAEISFFVNAKKGGAKKLPELVSSFPILVAGTSPASRSSVERLLESQGVSAKYIVTSDYPGIVLDLCINGQGIGVFSGEAIKDAEAMGLKRLRLSRKHSKVEERLFAIWPKGSENLAVVEHIRNLLPSRGMA